MVCCIKLLNLRNSQLNYRQRSGTTAGLGSKLRFIFRLSLNIQVQNHFPIKPIAQIRCSSCYRLELLQFY